jgi:hypothetical protein
MKRLRFTLLRFTLLRFTLLASLWTLSGCAAIGPSYPTPIPPEILPTAIIQTAEALNATAFALTPSPTATPLPTETPIPTITATPTPIPPAPPARLHFLQPGPMSVLTSAIQTKLYLVPGETNLVQVALYGEDGRLLARDLTRVEDVPPPGLELDLEIPFEIRAIELGRLEASIKDKFGRYESLNSMHVTLLPVGLSQVTPPDPPFERAAIYSPAAGANIYGGTLVVEGALWPVNDQPVILELQDEAGRILSTRQRSLTGDTYVPFTTTLPYKVSAPTAVRLSIRQTDPRFNMIAYLYSLLVVLNP